VDHKELPALLNVDRRLPRVESMRANKSSAPRIVSVLTELASHAVMGIALGLAFALIMLAVDEYGIAGLINQCAAQQATRLEFVGFVVLAFTFGVTLTGLAFILAEDS
jgi:hypothetical protein